MTHHRLRFDVWAVLAGSALGLVLGLVAVLSYRWPLPEGAGTVLIRAVLIYVPAGCLTGWLVRREHARRRERTEYVPPALHAMVTGVVVVVGHYIILRLMRTVATPALVWIAAEAFLAVMFAAVAGLIAGGRLSW